MSKLDLRARILLAALLPAAIIALLLAGFFVTARFADLDETLRERGRSQAHQIAVAAQYGVFSGNAQALQSLAEAGLSEPNTVGVVITGADKQMVGQVASEIRAVQPPEPYKGKGIRYSGEQVRRKAGKTAGA